MDGSGGGGFRGASPSKNRGTLTKPTKQRRDPFARTPCASASRGSPSSLPASSLPNVTTGKRREKVPGAKLPLRDNQKLAPLFLIGAIGSASESSAANQAGAGKQLTLKPIAELAFFFFFLVHRSMPERVKIRMDIWRKTKVSGIKHAHRSSRNLRCRSES